MSKEVTLSIHRDVIGLFQIFTMELYTAMIGAPLFEAGLSGKPVQITKPSS